ncbi:hypothetical protein XENTR_v10014178 [Xenopus tropicalis]|nr:hypothetical protein XENTR_v10014178 [Xenopus tropicalis]
MPKHFIAGTVLSPQYCHRQNKMFFVNVCLAFNYMQGSFFHLQKRFYTSSAEMESKNIPADERSCKMCMFWQIS